MRITITKGERSDRIEALRANGCAVSTTFPHKGPIPHDAVHFFVESGLGITDGFWGMVAAGRHPEEIAGIAKEAGHASAKRACVPDAAIIPIIQAERAVECFEADLWGGCDSHPDMIRATIAAGCAQSLVPAVEITDEAIGSIRSELKELLRRWTAGAPGEHLVLDWAEAAA
jgi:hypothetical protein